MFKRRPSALRRCPLCGSDGVIAWASEVIDAYDARVLLSCAECETTRELVATTWAVDAYARRHERQRWQIALALRRAERRRMAADVESLVAGLHRDLIGPDDFGAPRAITRARG